MAQKNDRNPLRLGQEAENIVNPRFHSQNAAVCRSAGVTALPCRVL